MKKNLIYVILLVVLGTVGLALLVQAPPKTDEQTGDERKGVVTEEVAYYKNTKGYLARPFSGENLPAIILIHEWWGLNNDIKELANRFAQEGYVALAVDLYNGKSTTVQAEAQQLSGQVRGNPDEAFSNLGAALDYLKIMREVDDNRLASVGWCFGGAWSYNMAVNNLGTKASVMYYGQFDLTDDFEHMKAAILGHFGENDAAIKVDNVREFQAKLATVNGDHEVYIYPNSGHGFANYREGANTGYNQEAADLAWSRTIAFLENVLNK